jgi:hypothetical protein
MIKTLKENREVIKKLGIVLALALVLCFQGVVFAQNSNSGEKKTTKSHGKRHGKKRWGKKKRHGHKGGGTKKGGTKKEGNKNM